LYVDPSRAPSTADNIRRLWPELWPFLGEDARLRYGLRCARSGASLDSGPATAARELLEVVDGTAYLPEDLRAGEIDTVLDTLMAAHHGMNNFYNEGAPARQLEALVGDKGTVPRAVARKYTRTLVEAFLGNGYGVAWAAVPSYRNLLQRLDSAEAERALNAFRDPSIASLLGSSVGRTQWIELLGILEPKLTNRRSRDLLTAVRGFNGTPDQLRLDSTIKKLLTLDR
ncbi:MAG TPA: hypothetical protein VFE45_15590, partial [Coriobacteriia bacterium]|nr:hypothetical protein [Coriobacteriia bacterium]